MGGDGGGLGNDAVIGQDEHEAALHEWIPYQYFTLQAVPRPDRGERVNVGVVLFSEEANALLMAWHVDAYRVRALDPHADVAALTASLRHTAALCSTPPNGDVPTAGMARARRPGALFGWLAAPRSTLVQPGPVHGGLCGDPADELDRLMRRLVLLGTPDRALRGQPARRDGSPSGGPLTRIGGMSLKRPVAPDPYTLLPPTGSFELTSPGFSDGEDLPAKHSFGEDNLSPALSWSGAPEGTKQFVVSCFDPDAPTPSGFWHWFVARLPADASGVDEGAGHIGGGSLPGAALQLKNDFGSRDFGGAAPPPGDRPHRYMFAVHALGVDELGLDADTSPAKASFMMLEHVLARAVLTGMFALDT